MNPIDYSINVPDPSQAFLSALNTGSAFQQQQLQQQQAQMAMQQQQAQQAALARLQQNPNPTADDYAAATLAIPGMREHFKQAYEMQNTAQQQNSLQHVGEVASALTMGKPDVATKLLDDRITALQNSGGKPEDIQAAQTIKQLIQTNPQMALGLMQSKLGSIPGGDKVLGNIKATAILPAEVATAGSTAVKTAAEASGAQADATIKGEQAKVAPTTVALGNQKTAQEIRSQQIGDQIKQLDAQIAAANSETERGKLQLERDKLTTEQAKLTQSQGQAAQDGMDSINQSLITMSAIKQHPGLENAWYQNVPLIGAPKSAPGSMWGGLIAKMPGTDRQALEGYVDTLKSQLGYNSLMAAQASSPTGASGFGALSEGELKLLSNLAGNLDTNSKDFPKQLATVETYLQKLQAKAVANPALPKQGGAYVATVPGVGVVDEGIINQVMKAHPGSTRAQVLQFIQSLGGK
jgi:hypothetical protein